MKNRFFVWSSVVVAALALMSCSKEQDIAIENEPKGVPFEIKASTIETKTANDNMATLWEKDDQINLFHAVNGETTYVNDNAFTATEDGASVFFTGDLGTALSEGNYDWFAVYPYAATFDTPAGSKSITIPASQTQVGNDSKAHLAGANCPVAGNVKNVAYDATPEVAFKHLTTIIKVHVTNKTASSIKVEGVSFTAPVNINGSFNLNLTGDDPALSGDGGSTTTALTVTSGAALATDEGADFYMAVKPFGVSAGAQLSLTVSTDAGDQTLTAVMPAGYTFAVGKIATLNFNFTNKASSLVQFKYNDADWLDAQGIDKPASGNGTNLDGSLQKVSPVYVAVQKKTGSDPKLWNNGGDYELRAYNNNKIVVASFNDKMITKITFLGACPASADVGTLLTSNMTWTGRAAQVTFSCTTKTFIDNINVFYEAVEESDHALFVPTTSYSVAYNATSLDIPIFVANATGLAAASTSPGCTSATPSVENGKVAVVMEANASTSPRDIVVTISSTNPVVSTDVTITQAGAPVTTLAGVKALYSSSPVAFTATLTNALVTTVSGNTFFMEDASGGIKGNLSGHGLSVGDKINGTITGTVTKTSGNYTLTSLDKSGATITTGNTVTPTTVEAATLASNFASYESKLVKVAGVEVYEVSDKNLTLDGIDGFIVYNNSTLALPVGSQFNAVGPATFYGSTKEIAIYTVEEADRISIVPTITISNTSVSVGSTVTLEPTINSTGAVTFTSLTPAKATVHSTSGVVTGVEAGDATIRVSVAADSYWTAGSKDITVTVSNTSYSWVKVTSLSGITAGEYVIISADKFLNNATATNAAPAQGDAPTITAGVIADANVTAAMKWTFSGSYTAVTITNPDSKTLVIGASGAQGTRVKSASGTWEFEYHTGENADNGFSMKSTYSESTLYLGVYGAGSNWRLYGTKNHANFGDSGKIYLYKKTAN